MAMTRWATYRTSTDISCQPHFDNIVQCLHYLFSWDICIHTLDLEDIDVRAQSFDARLYRIKNVLAGQSDSIHHPAIVDCGCKDEQRGLAGRTRAKPTFGDDDDTFSRDIVGGKGLGNDLLRNAI